MAATYTNVADGFNLFGTIPVQIANFIPDASYTTGGYLATGANFGLSTIGGGGTNVGIRGIVVIGWNTAASTYTAVWNTDTGKIMVLQAGVEVASTTNLSALSFKILVLASGE